MGIFGGIVLGALSGFIGFLPLFAALRIARRIASVKVSVVALCALGGVAVSVLLVGGLLYLCSVVAPDALLPFAIAELVGLVGSTSVYVVYKNIL